ncbi:MAG: ATP-binding protein [Phycisphaeraceae bacterium]
MRLRTRIFLAWAVLALVLWVGMFWLVETTVTASFDHRARDSFVRTRQALQRISQERTERMVEVGSLLMQIPELRALIAEHSYELQHAFSSSLQERLDYLADVVDASFIVALNAEGALIAAGGQLPEADPERIEAYLREGEPARQMVRRVFDQSPQQAGDGEVEGVSGLWGHERAIFQVVALPLVFQQGGADAPAPVEGALIIGRRLNDRLATELGQSQGCHVSFTSAGAVVASSLSLADHDRLIDVLPDAPGAGEHAFVAELTGQAYLTSYRQLRDPVSGESVGDMAIQRSLAASHQILGELSRNLLVAMALGLVLAACGSFALSAAITRPIHQLLAAVRRVAKGDLDQNIPARRRDELGSLAHAFNDMVSQLRERQQLERQVVEMETVTRTKTEFLANMSHEIRTPMTAILGYAELLKNPDQPAVDRQGAIDVIRRNGSYLLTIINDILDLSKIEAGQMQVERLACCPAEVLSDVASLMRLRAAEKNLSFEVALDTPIPATLHTDPTRLRQILINLLGNATKFTQAGGVRLTAGMDADGRQLCFRVTDTGVGMAAEEVERIFEPFSQADRSTTRRFGGTGLGLSICRELATMLGGGVTVDSAPGRGSTFTLCIDPGPVDGEVMIEQLYEAIRTDGSVEPTRDELRLAGRILLAEDAEDNRKLLTLFLQSAGAEVVVVDNGLAARDAALAADPPFDVIFMDMQMPQMDGYTATRCLRAKGYTGVIVALTANAMAEDQAKCRHCGCDDYLSKPVRAEVLIDTAARHMGGAEINAAAEEEGELDEAVQAFLETYVSSLPERVRQLLGLLQAQDAEELGKMLHQLKGSGGMYGFVDISRKAEAAEAAVYASRSIDEAAEQVRELVETIRRVQGYDPAAESASAG